VHAYCDDAIVIVVTDAIADCSAAWDRSTAGTQPRRHAILAVTATPELGIAVLKASDGEFLRDI
jgi:hypothetical protein